MVVVLILGMIISIGISFVQVMMVYDLFNWIMNFMQEMKVGQEYFQIVQCWSEMVQQYFKIIDNWMFKFQNWIQIIVFFLMLLIFVLMKIFENWNVVEKCGGDFMISMNGLMVVLNMSLGGDIGVQQCVICFYIQVFENKKYNEIVEVVQMFMLVMEQMFQQLCWICNVFKNEGVLQEDIFNNMVILVEFEKVFKKWEIIIKVYDQQIVVLQGWQKNLVECVLCGECNLIGSVIKVGVLKVVFFIK